MPWKECHVMDERLRFVARLLDGEKMAALCAEFGISRKTGYKIYDRYKSCGRAGPDRSQPAAVSARQSAAVRDREELIVRLKREYPELGRAEDSRAAAAALARGALPGDQHGPRGAGSPWPGDASPAPPPRAAGHARCRCPTAPNAPVVCGLQGRVHARQSALLLSAHDHRLRQPLSARLRGAVDDAGTLRLRGLRAGLSRLRPARRHPHR